MNYRMPWVNNIFKRKYNLFLIFKQRAAVPISVCPKGSQSPLSILSYIQYNLNKNFVLISSLIMSFSFVFTNQYGSCMYIYASFNPPFHIILSIEFNVIFLDTVGMVGKLCKYDTKAQTIKLSKKN